MDGKLYVLTIRNSNIFKEVDISRNTPVIKIGTLQDCDVRLKRELFEIPVCITVRLENHENDDWCVSCVGDLYISSADIRRCTETPIRHGDFMSVHNVSDEENLLTLSFSYDFALSARDFDTIIDIRNTPVLTIGGVSSANIILDSGFAGGEHITLTNGSDAEYSLMLDVAHAQNSATLNGVRIFGKEKVSEFDFFGLADYSFYFKNGVLYTAMRDDLHIRGILSQPLRDETPAFDYPKLNRSPRMIYDFDATPIEILNPPQKPEKPRDNIAMMLMPALLMAVVIVITRSGLIGGLNIGGMGFMIFSLASMSVGVLTSVMSFIHNRKRYKKELVAWHSDYAAYIAKKRKEIEAEQLRELNALTDVYPPSEQIRDFVKTFSGRLFERSPKDADFLHVRLGLGAVPAIRVPTFKHEEKVKTENELMEIPGQLCAEYCSIDNAPVMMRLREAGMVGAVGTPHEQYEFFKSMLLDICVQHHYEEVQVVVLLPQEARDKYEWVKWLPHIKESGGGVRGIVCDDESRDNVFEYLYALMTARNAEIADRNDKPLPLPFVVVFVLDEYAMKTHPLFQFAENYASLGFGFVCFKQYMENLPQYCVEIAELMPGGGILRMKNDKAFARRFAREQVQDTSIEFVAERLAPVFCEKIALSSRLTSNITLFELLNIISPEDLNLIELWGKSDVKKSLAAPLGVDAKGERLGLDLHEKAHGPHGLVAGTTGSGKSEIMQSYILSAAVNFHPYEVAFVIIDFKGGGMANQFEDLPHLVGKITDIDSHEINRSLLSIRAELEKRKRLFAEFEVNHIDAYISKFHSGEAQTPLPHLILIVDEFAELKAEQPEFMGELVSAARVGRSLGIHLILATQKPAGQVSEQIWSNSRFKLCLKVATKEDSNEVLRSPLASEIREPGRAYLQVGNNEIFTLFQSAYSGASAASDKHGNIREFSISEISFTGKRTKVWPIGSGPKAQSASEGASTKITQLKAMVSYINRYCEKAGIPRLPSICLPPLPEIIAYPEGDSVHMRIGIYDDPDSQLQPEATVDLSEGNIMVIGSAQTGKTMLLQTMLRGIAGNSSPRQTAVYILDFASKILKVYENLNYVGGVLTDADDERLKTFFKMMDEEIYSRKELFSQIGASSHESYIETAAGNQELAVAPRIVVIIDNLAAFKDMYQDYEDALLNICREGLALGVTVIATAKQTSGLSYKYFSNFANKIAFNCTESSEYGAIFDRCQLRPKDIQGRGLISKDKIIYEYQAFLAFGGETESQRNEQVKAFIADVAAIYGAERARKIPEIPAVLTEDYWVDDASGKFAFGDFIVPVGLTYREIEPVVIDLAHAGAVGIYGREGFGKSNLVRVVMDYLKRRVFDFPCEAYLIDGYDRQLSEFETYGFVKQFTIDCADFEHIVQHFESAASARMDILRMGGNLQHEPLLLCIVQNSQIFSADTVDRMVSDRFKKLLADSKQLKICFIFADIDNNGDYSAPEMLKIARELGQYFLLDDVANVRLFGSGKFNANELRDFKKAVSLGDGYLYDSRGGIEKIKLVKCNRG